MGSGGVSLEPKRMTVGTLIDALQKYPRDLPVVVDGYEGGATSRLVLVLTDVYPDVNGEGYFGEHEIVDEERTGRTTPEPLATLRISSD